MSNPADQLQNFITHESACPIWGTECQEKTQSASSITVVGSSRSGGDYVIDRDVFPELRQFYAGLHSEGFDNFRARLTTLLVRQRRFGDRCPRITVSTIARAQSASTLALQERLDSLMLFLIDSSPKVGEPISIVRPDQPREDLQNYQLALAHSESMEFQELSYLADSLHDRGLITKADVDIRDDLGRVRFNFGFRCTITIRGYSAMEQRRTAGRADQCFVAMWFNQTTDVLYDKAIEPAVIAVGYRPLRIDRKTDFLGRIDDQIVAKIRRSRFVIADFSHGSDSARGSVYYEAGFAHGLSIPVIFTCRDDQFDNLHFDTNHFLHLSWSVDSPEDLIEPLKNRITANLGYGPNPPVVDGGYQ